MCYFVGKSQLVHIYDALENSFQVDCALVEHIKLVSKSEVDAEIVEEAQFKQHTESRSTSMTILGSNSHKVFDSMKRLIFQFIRTVMFGGNFQIRRSRRHQKHPKYSDIDTIQDRIDEDDDIYYYNENKEFNVREIDAVGEMNLKLKISSKQK